MPCQPLSFTAPLSAAWERPTKPASYHLQFSSPTVFHLLPDCVLLLTMDPPIAPVHKAQSSSYKNKDLTGLVPILCATRYKQHPYHFSSLCICNLLVAHLSRLRSPSGTPDSAGQAAVRPSDMCWRMNACAGFVFWLYCFPTRENTLKAVMGKVLDIWVTAKGTVSGRNLCHSEA